MNMYILVLFLASFWAITIHCMESDKPYFDHDKLDQYIIDVEPSTRPGVPIYITIGVPKETDPLLPGQAPRRRFTCSPKSVACCSAVCTIAALVIIPTYLCMYPPS